jgi:hypothetical protein
MTNPVKINLVPRLLLLFCLLLAAQGIALAHQLDHLATEDSSSCVICPVGSNIQAAALDSGDISGPGKYTAIRPVSIGHLCVTEVATGSSARAPPSFL